MVDDGPEALPNDGKRQFSMMDQWVFGGDAAPVKIKVFSIQPFGALSAQEARKITAPSATNTFLKKYSGFKYDDIGSGMPVQRMCLDDFTARFNRALIPIYGKDRAYNGEQLRDGIFRELAVSLGIPHDHFIFSHNFLQSYFHSVEPFSGQPKAYVLALENFKNSRESQAMLSNTAIFGFVNAIFSLMANPCAPDSLFDSTGKWELPHLYFALMNYALRCKEHPNPYFLTVLNMLQQMLVDAGITSVMHRDLNARLLFSAIREWGNPDEKCSQRKVLGMLHQSCLVSRPKSKCKSRDKKQHKMCLIPATLALHEGNMIMGCQIATNSSGDISGVILRASKSKCKQQQIARMAINIGDTINYSRGETDNKALEPFLQNHITEFGEIVTFHNTVRVCAHNLLLKSKEGWAHLITFATNNRSYQRCLIDLGNLLQGKSILVGRGKIRPKLISLLNKYKVHSITLRSARMNQQPADVYLSSYYSKVPLPRLLQTQQRNARAAKRSQRKASKKMEIDSHGMND